MHDVLAVDQRRSRAVKGYGRSSVRRIMFLLELCFVLRFADSHAEMNSRHGGENRAD
jgi:hypothetical protein